VSPHPTTPTERLRALGLELPAPDPVLAWHLPVAQDDGLLWVSGQVPFVDGALLHTGALATDEDVAVGYACARRCAAHVLAQLARAAGSLERIVAVPKLTVFVASAPGFTRQPEVAHGASELLHEVLGDAGRHARSAVGVAALPLGAPVEVEAVARVGAAG
jgi:enamine deaminase RidA (YjgF/YER057c/UK114 family)